jgi:hypothetical protein
MSLFSYYYDEIETLRQQLSQPLEGSSEPQPVDETDLYFQAVGGEKKKRVYRMGSSGSSYYGGGSGCASSSSQNNIRNVQLEHRVEQLQEQLQRMEEDSRRRDEENRELRQHMDRQNQMNAQWMAFMQSGGWNVNQPAPPAQNDADDDEDGNNGFDGLDDGGHGD